MAKPMPAVEPVTMAVLPERSMCMISDAPGRRSTQAALARDKVNERTFTRAPLECQTLVSRYMPAACQSARKAVFSKEQAGRAAGDLSHAC
jgi:hypothetical protein